jgi:hypothetical protein
MALHVDPQLMPTGALTTVPVPVPESETVSLAVKVGETPNPPQPPNAAMKIMITLRDAARAKYRESMLSNS